MKEEIKRWIKMAKDDFDSAEANFKIKKYYVCVLLCQQSIEKALKAVLLKKTGKIIKVHDLYLLGEKVDLPDPF